MALTEFAAGYTDDGPDSKVWLRVNASGPDGTPLETTLIMTPKQASAVSQLLVQAADECVDRGRLIKLQ